MHIPLMEFEMAILELAAPDEEVEVTETETDEPVQDITDESAASDGDDSTAEPTKPRASRGVQKKIDKLTRQVHEQRRQIAELSTPREQAKAAPKRDDFDDYEQYIDARSEYVVEQRLAKADENRQTQVNEARQRESAESYEETRESIIESGMDSFPDFEQVAMVNDGSLSISQAMADAILSSDAGHEVWYHLGKNPAKAEKIASLPPVKQILEMGKLEASLKAGKQPSNAPAPTKSVGNRGSTSNDLSDKLSMDEWVKRRNKQVRG